MKQLLRRAAVEQGQKRCGGRQGRQLVASLLWGRHGHCHQTSGLQIWLLPLFAKASPRAKPMPQLILFGHDLPTAPPRFPPLRIDSATLSGRSPDLRAVAYLDGKGASAFIGHGSPA